MFEKINEKHKQRKDIVFAFGVFDGLHPGHDYFLSQARKRGGGLYVAVARDSIVKKLKGRMPRRREKNRLAEVRAHPAVTRALLGDRILGEYRMLRRIKPLLICVGYDQGALRDDLHMRMKNGQLPRTRIARIRAHMPDMYKSSLLR